MKMKVSVISAMILTLVFTYIVGVSAQADLRSADMLYAVARDGGGVVVNIIYAASAAGGDPTEVGTVRQPGSDAGWSPSGKFIYLLDYDPERQRMLTLLEADTDQRIPIPEPLRVDECALPFWWSSDDRWLAYSTEANPDSTIRLFDTSTGETHSLSVEEPIYSWVNWSPNGRYLLFELASQTAQRSFAVWDAETQQRVASFQANTLRSAPSWSPSGSRLAYSDSETDEIVIRDVEGTAEQRYPPGFIGQWSPDGRYLTAAHLVADTHFTFTLSVFDVEAGTPLVLEGEIGEPDIYPDTFWSSNGRYLAIAIIDPEQRFARAIYALDVDSGVSLRLTDSPLYRFRLSWSPAAPVLAAVAAAENASEESTDTGESASPLDVFDLERNRSDRFTVELPPYFYEPTLGWSPDGRYLVAWTYPAVSLYNHETGQLASLSDFPGGSSLAYWSPDGANLLLPAYSADVNDLFLYTPENGALRNITGTPDEMETFLGWRGANQNYSLIFCGEG